MGQCASKRYHAVQEQQHRDEHLRKKLREDSANRNLQVQDAIVSGDLSRVRELLHRLQTDVNEALLFAGKAGKLKIVQGLVDKENADVDHQDLKGWTLLHHACDKGQLECVRWLACHTSASANVRDLDGETPLHKLRAVNFKAKKGEEKNPLDMFEIMRLLVEEGGADPDCSNHEGQTFLQVFEELHGKNASPHLPSWVRDRSKMKDSYFDFAESDYDLESTASDSVACSLLSLNRYHTDTASEMRDYNINFWVNEWVNAPNTGEKSQLTKENIDATSRVDLDLESDDQSKKGAFYYDLDGSEIDMDKDEKEVDKPLGMSVEDWILYLSGSPEQDMSEGEDGTNKILITPDTSTETEEMSQTEVGFVATASNIGENEGNAAKASSICAPENSLHCDEIFTDDDRSMMEGGDMEGVNFEEDALMQTDNIPSTDSDKAETSEGGVSFDEDSVTPQINLKYKRDSNKATSSQSRSGDEDIELPESAQDSRVTTPWDIRKQHDKLPVTPDTTMEDDDALSVTESELYTDCVGTRPSFQDTALFI